MTENAPIPTKWREDFLGKADLEHSFAQLHGLEHFHAEMMRGRIRSLQLRVAEAWEHFARAEERAAKAEETIRNLVNRLVLQAYKLYNAVLEAPIGNQTTIDEEPLPTSSDEVLERFPEIRGAIRVRIQANGLVLLNLGRWHDAAERYEELIAESQGTPDGIVWGYLGLGACQYNLGAQADAFRSLENAGLAVQNCKWTLNAGRAAAILSALYSQISSCEEEAKNWEDFLERLRCPGATKAVLLRRADAVRERCIHHNSLVVL